MTAPPTISDRTAGTSAIPRGSSNQRVTRGSSGRTGIVRRCCQPVFHAIRRWNPVWVGPPIVCTPGATPTSTVRGCGRSERPGARSRARSATCFAFRNSNRRRRRLLFHTEDLLDRYQRLPAPQLSLGRHRRSMKSRRCGLGSCISNSTRTPPGTLPGTRQSLRHQHGNFGLSLLQCLLTAVLVQV